MLAHIFTCAHTHTHTSTHTHTHTHSGQHKQVGIYKLVTYVQIVYLSHSIHFHSVRVMLNVTLVEYYKFIFCCCLPTRLHLNVHLVIYTLLFINCFVGLGALKS